jgi:hypothetical protein
MSVAFPPCACCTKRVPISENKKGPNQKKIHESNCCEAVLCWSCGPGGFCVFCKKPILTTRVVRKTSYPDWGSRFMVFWKLEQLTEEQPLFLDFLKNSKNFVDYRFSFNIPMEIKLYKLYIDSQVINSLLKQIIQFRVSTPRSFPFRTSDEIEIYQKMKICQKMYSIVNSSDFARIYQQHLKKSAIVMRYSCKFCQFGCILFIALKLSTLKLKTMLFPDVNAIRRIISRFTKNIAR